MNDAQSSFDRAEADYESLRGTGVGDGYTHLPQGEDIDFQGCDVCAAPAGEEHDALCPDIRDGLAMSIRPQGDDMFDFLIDLGHKLRDASYNLEN